MSNIDAELKKFVAYNKGLHACKECVENLWVCGLVKGGSVVSLFVTKILCIVF